MLCLPVAHDVPMPTGGNGSSRVKQTQHCSTSAKICLFFATKMRG